jgi:predicted phosphodiesterase
MAFSSPSGLDALLRRPEQSIWSRFLRAPVRVLAELVYRRFAQTSILPDADGPTIRVVCISDTHNTQPQLPDGDLLIHAGDLTQSGTQAELEAQIEWLDRQPHRFKVAIAGNHELCLDPKASGPNPTEPVDWKSIRYLENSSTTLDFGDRRRVKVFGSPYTPRHGNWAFQYPRTENIWDEIQIPEDIAILVTHGPPKTHFDLGRKGCKFLRDWLWSVKRKPLLHVFGHIHAAYGKETLCWDDFQRAYESIMDNEAKWMNLIRLLWHALVRLIRPRSPCGRTVMVNAAAIGGLRDEKRRDAICVDIYFS